MKIITRLGILLCFSLIFSACGGKLSGDLPIIGKKEIIDGKVVHHRIPHWSYIDQDSTIVTDQALKDYIYVVDFFFISCPSICPRVTKEMKRIYDAFEGDDRVRFVSFTIDPERDTPGRLKAYKEKLGIQDDRWIFLCGDRDATFDLANEYFVVAYKDDEVPGGFDHSGKIILVDKEGHIRSFTEGTQAEDTPKFISDVKRLLKSYD